MAMALGVTLAPGATAADSPALQDEHAIREACSGESEAGMRECLAKRAADSDKKLKQAEQKALDAVSKWDEDGKYIRLARNELQSSGKAFTQYRKAQCDFAASLGGGAIGNALDMRRFACEAELNERRAEQLRAAVQDLPRR
ncbi:DUF1311 domain-containing protein [Trinickia caryophylli]|nr:hypothetical protein C0Z17_00545 [Trinickia caryophylli]TRX20219.1 DUF1311 domain-containing protein [Trinickia caryophylli]